MGNCTAFALLLQSVGWLDEIRITVRKYAVRNT